MAINFIFESKPQEVVERRVIRCATKLFVHHRIDHPLAILQNPTLIGNQFAGGNVSVDHVINHRSRQAGLVVVRQNAFKMLAREDNLDVNIDAFNADGFAHDGGESTAPCRHRQILITVDPGTSRREMNQENLTKINSHPVV